MEIHVYAEYYYTLDYGIMIYSKANIYEHSFADESLWINHTFVRELKKYTDFSETISDEPEDTFENFIFNPLNIVAISMIILILIATPAAFWIIHRQKVLREFQSYKAVIRDKKGISPQKTLKKQKNSQKT